MSRLFIRRAALICVLLLQGACSKTSEPLEQSQPALRPQKSTNTASTVGTSWAGQLRAAHQLADTANSPQQLRAAAGQLLELAQSEERPTTNDAAQARLTLRQDAAARAGELLLHAGAPKDARSALKAGLSITDQASSARAQLFIVLADVEQAEGNHSASNAALLQALHINQALFEQEIADP